VLPAVRWMPSASPDFGERRRCWPSSIIPTSLRRHKLPHQSARAATRECRQGDRWRAGRRAGCDVLGTGAATLRELRSRSKVARAWIMPPTPTAGVHEYVPTLMATPGQMRARQGTCVRRPPVLAVCVPICGADLGGEN
jgi:hypothetical protein